MAQVSLPKRYKDLDLLFTAHPVRKDVNILTDDNAVITSVRNLLFTNYYDRLFQPNVGSNLTGLLFENMDFFTAAKVQRAITETIRNYEPRVTVNKLSVKPNFEGNSYSCDMEFIIVNKTDPVRITFFLERVR
jgi:phage baseplate assembly protein W